MISGKENLLEWFKMQGKPIFSIFRKNKEESGNFVYTNKDRENETIETAAAYLDRCLSLLTSGDFFIYCHGLTPSSKGRSEMYFTINYSHIPAIIPQNMPAVSGYNEDTVMQKAQAMATDLFQKMMDAKELKDTKEKLAELTKENKELAAQVAAPMRQFIGEVMPYIGGIAEHFGLTKTIATPLPVSGVAPDTHIDDNNPGEAVEGTAEEQRINNAIQAFAEALAARYPGEWITIVERLTATLKTSPEKIDMALKFL